MFTVKQIAARKVAGFHWVGPWDNTLPQGFEQLAAWSERHQLNGERLAIYYDDPDNVPAEHLRCDTVISVADDFVLPTDSTGVRLITIPAGLYAVERASIENNAFFAAWEDLFDQVEAEGRYRLTGAPCYERYLNEGSQSGIWELEMLIPVTHLQELPPMIDNIPDLSVLFIAGYGPVPHDSAASQAFYQQTLGLPLKGMPGNESYLSLDAGTLDGVKHFALWPLDQAAHACFGVDRWPETYPAPQSWIEFEVAALDVASQRLKALGYQLLVDNRQEPWGQTVTRLLSPEGLLVGLTITPWLR